MTLPQERFDISTTTVSNLFDTVPDVELIYLAMTSPSVFKIIIILINAFFLKVTQGSLKLGLEFSQRFESNVVWRC